MHPLAFVALLALINAPPLVLEERALALPPTDIVQAFPAVETVVPENGRLVLFGGSTGAVTFVRTRGDGAEDALEHVTLPVDSFSFQQAHIVTLPALVVGETLVVSARCATCSFSGTWTVGAADEQSPVFDDGPIAVDVDPLSSGEPFAPVSAYSLQVRLPGARDTQSPVAIELRGNEEVNRFDTQVFAPGQPMTIFMQLPGSAARTVCFDAVAVDTAGNEAAFDDELCADLAPAGGGCAQASPSTNTLVVLAILMLLVARCLQRCACT
jgi:hypothetical protein